MISLCASNSCLDDVAIYPSTLVIPSCAASNLTSFSFEALSDGILEGLENFTVLLMLDNQTSDEAMVNLDQGRATVFIVENGSKFRL